KTRLERGKNYHFYSTLGLFLAVAGSAILATPAVAAAGWAVLAVLLAWLSGRLGWVSLSWQCTLLLLAAAAGSGVLLAGIQALAGDPAAAWPEVGPWHLTVASATVASLFVPVAHHSARWGRLSGVPQLVVLALSVWAVGGLLVAFLAPWVAGVPAEDADLGALAALRTGILAGSAVTLALSSLHPRWPEARWLAYPVLIVIAVKLVIEDFPLGHPASLFVSLALVGGSMIAVSRLMGRKSAESGLR
ncbi:MAG: hypothetical protein R3200_17145, partial [Xanthomonadales bacterium]|nr:hypothetical protein [Xanthomonadales bacterium]